jgi:hypothetical protein
VTDILSPATRQKVYAVFALLGVALGAVQVAFSAADSGQPEWLTVTLAVYAFLGGALGLTAASNTKPIASVVPAQVDTGRFIVNLAPGEHVLTADDIRKRADDSIAAMRKALDLPET